MASNPMPWVILACVVLAVLYFKGYVHLPRTGTSPVQPIGPLMTPDAPPAAADSTALGILFAQAKRREVEDKIAIQVALEAGKQIEEMFASPFLKPATAGPAPQAAVASQPQGSV